MRSLQDHSELHDYTELVIQLWTSYMVYGFNLSNLGGGDSMAGIDRIRYDALFFLDVVKSKEAEGWWWDGGWIEAVQEYAHRTAAIFKYGLAHHEVVEFDITKYMEPKETV